MDDTELLKEIKTRLQIEGDYHDALLLAYAEDVKAYMLSGGVKPRVINGSSSIGCIARGVADLWNYGSGEGKFSEVFYQRVIQLSLPMASMEDGSEDFDEMTEEEIDEIVDGEIPVEEPDYEIMDEEDIDEIVSGNVDDEPETEEPENPDSGDEYEYITEEELDELFK